MQARTLGTFALAAVLAAISVALAHAWLNAAARGPMAAPAAGVETVPVVVAARDLVYGDTLRASDLKLADWPEAALPPGAFHAVDSLFGASNEGDPIVLGAIGAAEPILSGKITGFGAPGRLGATIAAGKRAMTVDTSGGGIAALIGPGDRVDVLISRELQRQGQERELRSDVLLHDVRVLGLDRPSISGATPGRAGPVTLEVTLEQAQKLALAQKVGSLSLVLRGPETGDAGGGGPISSRDLPAGHKSQALPATAPSSASLLPDFLRDRIEPILTPAARASVRIVRGLETSLYEVGPEDGASAIATIDAAKAPKRITPNRVEVSR